MVIEDKSQEIKQRRRAMENETRLPLTQRFHEYNESIRSLMNEVAALERENLSSQENFAGLLVSRVVYEPDGTVNLQASSPLLTALIHEVIAAMKAGGAKNTWALTSAPVVNGCTGEVDRLHITLQWQNGETYSDLYTKAMAKIKALQDELQKGSKR